MDPDQQLRNLRDFLLVYNRMTEICFQRCSSNFNYRNLTMEEERCVDNCAGKLIRSNHRLMGTYVQLMPRMVQRRMDEMESKAKAAEAAASANVGPPATEASPASQTPVTLAPPPEAPPVLTPAVADVGQEAHGSLLKPAGLDIPVDLSTVASSTAVATEVKLSAATPLTPAIEAVNPGVLNDAGHGPSHTAGFPQMSIAGAQTESESLMHMSAPFKPTPLTGDAPVSAVPAPAVSKPTESLSGPERAPEVAPPSSQ